MASATSSPVTPAQAACAARGHEPWVIASYTVDVDTWGMKKKRVRYCTGCNMENPSSRPTRPPRPSKDENAGLRSTRWNRDHGAWISVYDGEPTGMDTFAGRWQTVCELHGEVCSHETLAIAHSFAAAPEEWCEGEDA